MRQTKWHKKWLSLLLSVSMLLSTAELPVSAKEPAKDVRMEAEGVVVVSEGVETPYGILSQVILTTSDGEDQPLTVLINPVEEGEVTIESAIAHYREVERRREEAAREEGLGDPTQDINAAVCASDEEAITYLRDQMIARKDEIVVNCGSSVTLSCSELFYAAMEDTPDSPGNGGDYLMGHYSSVSLGYQSAKAYRYVIGFRTNAEQEQQVDAFLENVYSELALDSKTEIEKREAIYDYLTNHACYDYYALGLGADEYPQGWTAWNNLINGTSVCQGFALSLYRMYKDNGISTRYISGIGNTGAHAWNIMEYDGLYYNMDATWDCYTVDDGGNRKTDGKRTYFMKSTADFLNHTRDAKYDTDEFHAKYLMADLSYGKEEGSVPKLLSIPNKTGTFQTAQGGTFSVETSGLDFVKILIFSKNIPNQVNNLQYYLKSFSTRGVFEYPGVSVAVICTNNETQSEAEAFQESVGSSDVVFCYGAAANGLMWSYYDEYSEGTLYVPMFVLIDKDNQVRAIHYGSLDDSFYEAIDYLWEAQYETAEILSATALESGNRIAWTPVSGAEEYKVYRAVQEKSEYKLLASVTTDFYLDTTADARATSWYRVEAIVGGKSTGRSQAVAVTPEITPEPKSVTLSAKTLTLFAGQPAALVATVVPDIDGASISQKVVWSSSAEDVVSVADDGTLAAKKPGSASIKASCAAKETVFASCAVTVREDYTITYELNGGTLAEANPTKYNPYCGKLALNAPQKAESDFAGWYRAATFDEDTKMTEIAAGSDFGDITLYAKWRDWDAAAEPEASVATGGVVDEDSLLTLSCATEGAKIYYTLDGSEPTAESTLYVDGIRMKYEYAADGKITVKAIAVKEGCKASPVSAFVYTLHEILSVKEVLPDKTEVSLFSGETLQLAATVVPDKEGRAISQEVAWSSEDETVAAVDADGVVRGIAPGTTVIRAASTYDTSVTGTCIVTVKEDYTITYELNGGNLDQENPAHYNPFTETLSLHAPAKDGYSFSGWYRTESFDDGTKMTEIAKGSDFGNLKLYARWRDQDMLAEPEASVATGGVVDEDSLLTLRAGDEGAKIYYTLDGSAPTAESLLYTDGIRMKNEYAADGKITVKAIAVKEGSKDSLIATFVYTLHKRESQGDILPEDMPADGVIPDGVWVAGVQTSVYTGKAVTFNLRVYDYDRLLTEKADYTVSYKNNKNANDKSVINKAPTVIVAGKGNYKDKITKTFAIEPRSLGDGEDAAEGIDIEKPALAYNGKVQNPIPVVMADGVKLKAKKDYIVKAYGFASGEDEAADPSSLCKSLGTYRIVVEGVGNYTGSVETTMTITDAKLMKGATIVLPKEVPYANGEKVEPPVELRYGKETIKSGYTVEYRNNTEIGTATVTVTGTDGTIVGSKTATFRITGVPLSKVTFSGMPAAIPYSGSPVSADAVALTYTDQSGRTEALKEGADYTVSYKNGQHTAVGTVTVLFTGRGKYVGSVQKKFKITPYDLAEDTRKKLEVTYDREVPYAKGGSVPEVFVTFDGEPLQAGKDYILSCQNNKAVTAGGAAAGKPSFVIKGKGNFTGVTAQYPFEITKQDISRLKAVAADKANPGKAGKYLQAPKIVDVDGKVLKAGTDYDKKIIYKYDEDVTLENGETRAAGEEVGAADVLPGDCVCVLRAEITGLGNYAGSETVAKYRIVRYDLAKAKVTVKPQTYTGGASEPGKDQITVTLGGKSLSEDDYEIVSYSGQVGKGKASLVIRGKGVYGGEKTCKYNVVNKSFRASQESVLR